MSLICKESLKMSLMQRLWSRLISLGPIPKHIALIMDGNRRFAAKNQVEKIEGHTRGFDKLAEVLQWCLNLHVEEVTVYAFSAENFKRSTDEVESLMELARAKLSSILHEKDQLKANGVRVCIVGELDKLPEDVQKLAKEVVNMTKLNTKCKLNVCLAYTSRHEMVHAMKNIAKHLEEGKISSEEDITQALFNTILEIDKVDLIIRTSGEIRLSDFLLWQCSFASIEFATALWPELSVWDFYIAIFKFQERLRNAA